jgi:coenzyme F420-reducing hydrogenase delta subunit
MCSGRVTPAFVLKAFKLGADGVMVSGCHFGDCHYIFGNYKAVEQFERTKALVKTLGLDERRVALEWVSAAEGTRWGEVIDSFVAQVRALGPSPLNHTKPALRKR